MVAVRKTMKRETASLMLTYLGGMFIWGVFDPSARGIAEFLMPPVFLFAAGAFGMDAYSKQIMEDQ